MARMWERALRVLSRPGSTRSSGVVYVPDRLATPAERRYSDALVGIGPVRRGRPALSGVDASAARGAVSIV